MDEALEYFYRCLKHHERYGENSDFHALGRLYYQIGKIYKSRFAMEEATTFFAKAVSYFRKQLNYRQPEMLELIFTTACTFQFCHQLDQAENYFLEALSVVEEQPEQDAFLLNRLYLMLGLNNLLQQNNEKAINYLRKINSVIFDKIQPKGLMESHYHYALGSYYQNIGDLDKALEQVYQGISLIEQTSRNTITHHNQEGHHHHEHEDKLWQRDLNPNYTLLLGMGARLMLQKWEANPD